MNLNFIPRLHNLNPPRLASVTEKSWREACAGMSKFSEIMAYMAGKLGQNLVQVRQSTPKPAYGAISLL